MKQASGALVGLLNSSTSFIMADLYTFTLASGAVTCFTAADQPLTVNGHTYAANGPLFERDTLKVEVGVTVDQLSVTLYPRPTDQLGSTALFSLALNGGLDGARLLVERCFMRWGDTSCGTVHLFEGRVSDLEITRESVKLTINSDLELLNIQLPRNVYQPSCLNTLFDSGCGLAKAAYGVASVVAPGSSSSAIVSTSLNQIMAQSVPAPLTRPWW